ncbi:unnamed protein product [Euphydryas editha]|uniref:THAP-type domain-containing protein n=1 Tax=Euphydryas editha TaxID=104508 RepID=A0AAU9URF2_EUPED|nr:unnamed protein product [Euphydryas editha]
MPSLSRCVFGCVTKGVSIHNFPNPSKFPERFRQWVNLVGAPLFGISDAEIYKKYKVCDVHFTNEDRNRNKRLNAIAVPSLCISHVGYKQMEMDQHDVKPSTSKSMCPSGKILIHS